MNEGRFPKRKLLKSEPTAHFGGERGLENMGAVHLKKNIFRVSGFKHFPLILDRLYKINPNCTDSFCL